MQGWLRHTRVSIARGGAPIKPVFASTGWKTVALDHITFQMSDYRKEAAFYIALMGWTLRSDDGKQAVLDIGNWGSAIFKQAPGQRSATVENLCFVIAPWNARTVQAELRRRGLRPVDENDGKGFESFHVKDPVGLDLQISNGNGLAKARGTPATAKLSAPADRSHLVRDLAMGYGGGEGGTRETRAQSADRHLTEDQGVSVLLFQHGGARAGAHPHCPRWTVREVLA